MDQGLRAAGAADYVLFTDADIAYAPGTVSALVRAAEADNRVLVSQMALLRADTFAERLLIPAFVYFFAQLYPFRRISKRGGRTAGAAGGCMLVRRSALRDAGGLEQIKGARIDDVALGGLLKRAPGGGDCWLGFSTDVISKREYTGLPEIWDMVARSAYTQLRYSPAALAGTVIGLAWLYLVPVAAAVAGLILLIGGDSLSGVPASQAALLAAAGMAGWATDVGQLRADPEAQPPVPAPIARPAADRGPVHGDDDQLSPAAPRWPGRRMEGPHHPARPQRVGWSGGREIGLTRSAGSRLP